MSSSVLIDPFAAPVVPEPNENDPLQDIFRVKLPQCNLTYAEDLFKPDIFQEARRVEWTNRIAVRFGGSRDMLSGFFNGSESDQNKYLFGLLGSSICICLLFLAFTTLITLFKGFGYTRVGFCCGRFVRLPKPEHEEGKNSQIQFEQSIGRKKSKDWQTMCKQQEIRLFRTRIFLILAALFVVASCAVFVYYGLDYIRDSFVAVDDGLRHVQRLCQGGVTVFDNLDERQQELLDSIQTDRALVNGICAAQPLCESLEPPKDCDFTPIPAALRAAFGDVFRSIYQTATFVFEDIESFRADLLDLSDRIETYLTVENEMEWAFWAALAFALALGVLDLITIFGVVLLMRGPGTGKVFRFMRLRLLFPLIIIFALLTLVFSIVCVAGAVATADWCHNGPDAKVSYLLDEYQDNVDSVIYQFARYYVNTCDSELAPIRIVTQSQLSLNITTQVSGLLSQINTFDEAVWREACGDSLTGLQVILEGLVGGLCVLGQTVEDLNRYFWCRNWNPVYGFFMHDGICQDATEGIGWIAAAMFWVRTFHSLWIGKK